MWPFRQRIPSVRGQRSRRVQRAIVALVALAILVPIAIVECPMSSIPRPGARLLPVGNSYRIYVANWGYHTSVIVEQPEGWALGPAGDPEARFVEYAWGNRRYYMDTHPGWLTGMIALLVPGKSATYVEAWSAPPIPRGWSRLRLYTREISATQLVMLISALERWIDRTALYPAVPGYAGRFYGGMRSYLWWYDCNRWTVDRLADAGLASGGRGVLFAGQVASHLKAFRPVTSGHAAGVTP